MAGDKLADLDAYIAAEEAALARGGSVAAAPPPAERRRDGAVAAKEEPLRGDPVPGMCALLDVLAVHASGGGIDFDALLGVFSALDVDRSGRLDDAAFACGLRKAARELTWPEIDGLMHRMYLDGCTTIDYADFVAALRAIAASAGA